MSIIEINLKTKQKSVRDWADDELVSHNESVKKDEETINNGKVLSALHELDMRSIRALRAGDTEYIASLEAKAVELRKKLK